MTNVSSWIQPDVQNYRPLILILPEITQTFKFGTRMSNIELNAVAKGPPRPHPASLGAAGTELPCIATYVCTGESRGCVCNCAGTTYLTASSCRFSKDLAGLGGAATLRAALLGVGDLSVRGDPSAVVKKAKSNQGNVSKTH